MNPVFSVIIPAHNEEKYIKRCIRSVKRAAEYAGALIRASLGDPSELDGLLDKLFYDYNG